MNDGQMRNIILVFLFQHLPPGGTFRADIRGVIGDVIGEDAEAGAMQALDELKMAGMVEDLGDTRYILTSKGLMATHLITAVRIVRGVQ